MEQTRLAEEQRIDTWLKEHDGDDYCQYCIYANKCAHGIVCYGGSPIEPPCCGADIKTLLDTDQLLADLEEEING